MKQSCNNNSILSDNQFVERTKKLNKTKQKIDIYLFRELK